MKSSINSKRQQGAALIVSLIMLLAMTMLAVTSMRGTTTELAMAGNLRESSLAFQSAEAGLRFAEAQVAISTSTSSITGQIGKLDADPDYLNATSWTGTSAQTASIDLDTSVGVDAPQYMIKFIDENSSNPLAELNIGGGYNAPASHPPVAIYRVTARAAGLTGNTFRAVQSHYGIEY
ncbi:MAG: hypothetical protein GY784_18725 [Gammaproteobacteria bacterium]|nr:hypothetical protein [Gammaproteobacteria bacterium]